MHEASEKDRERERMFVGVDDVIRKDVHNVAIIRREYDVVGNVSRLTYYDTATNRVLNGEGVSRYDYVYKYNANRKGVCRLECRFDVDDEPITVIAFERDQDDRILTQKFTPATIRTGTSDEMLGGWHSKYDVNGNESERRYFNGKGKFCLYGGIAGWRKKYDRQGRVREEVYLNERGDEIGWWVTKNDLPLVYGKKRTFDYCDNGETVEFVDRREEASLLGGDRLKWTYSAAGEMLSLEILNQKGNLVNGTNGFARCLYQYDRTGNLSDQSYWNVEGLPALGPMGCHRFSLVTCPMTGNREWKEAHFFGTNGLHLVGHPNISPVSRMVFNEQKRPIFVDAYAGDVNRGPMKVGWVEIEYGLGGNIAAFTYFNESEKSKCRVEILSKTVGKVKVRIVFTDARQHSESKIVELDENNQMLVGIRNMVSTRAWWLK